MYNNSTWIKLVLHAMLINTAIKEIVCKIDGCDAALGMESGHITDSQISASSYMIAPPSAARLNKQWHSILGTWCAIYRDPSPYLQIDLIDVKNITAVSSQGVEFTGDHWISSYTLSYSCDGRVWQIYGNGSTAKIFSANIDTDSVVRNILPKSITARMIRIHPVTWHHWGSTCMRVEIHGCKSEQVCRPTSQATTPPLRTTTTTLRPFKIWRTRKLSTAVTSSTAVMSPTQTTRTTVKTNTPCIGALGMENYQIKSHQITASSTKSPWTLPSAARLNNRLKASSFGSWCASRTDSNQYLQVDLWKETTIVAIATQGMAFPEGNWVTSYTVSYSCDGVTWFAYGDNGKRKVFLGNSDSNQIVKNYLSPPLTTRIVRLKPAKWNKFGIICVRMELYGCTSSKACTKGNISDTFFPATTSRTKRRRPTIQDIVHDPVRRTKPTAHPSKPTRTLQTTKKKKRIVIIYKKIEDDYTSSSAKKLTLRWIIALLFTLISTLISKL